MMGRISILKALLDRVFLGEIPIDFSILLYYFDLMSDKKNIMRDSSSASALLFSIQLD